VERWVENPYWQQFCGMSDFQWELPCDPSDLVYFRQRIGEQGVALILAVSAQMHGERARESEVVVDSKNMTYPLDTKQYRKIIIRCWRLADRDRVRPRRRYRKEVRACVMAQRLRKDRRKRKAARRRHRRLRIIAGALIRELERKLPTVIVFSADSDVSPAVCQPTSLRFRLRDNSNRGSPYELTPLRLIGDFCHASITRFNSGSAEALAVCESPCESRVVSS